MWKYFTVSGCMVLVTTLAVLAQSQFLGSLPGPVNSGAIHNDSLFILVRSGNYITERSVTSGHSKSHYASSSTEQLEILGTLGFAIDRFGKVHSLIHTTTLAIFRQFDDAYTHRDVLLEPRCAGRELHIDRHGNYYVRGRIAPDEDALLDWVIGGKESIGGQLICLVHKYSSNGKLIESYFPMKVPLEREAADHFRKSHGMARLTVLPSGEVFLLQASPTGGPELGPLEGFEYSLLWSDTPGGAEELELIPPFDGAFPLNLHRFGPNEVLVEWHGFLGGASRIELTRIGDHQTIYEAQESKIDHPIVVTVEEAMIILARREGNPPTYRLERVSLPDTD